MLFLSSPILTIGEEVRSCLGCSDLEWYLLLLFWYSVCASFCKHPLANMRGHYFLVVQAWQNSNWIRICFEERSHRKQRAPPPCLEDGIKLNPCEATSFVELSISTRPQMCYLLDAAIAEDNPQYPKGRLPSASCPSSPPSPVPFPTCLCYLKSRGR